MPEASPVATENGIRVFDLDIREGIAEILPGMQTPIYGYDGIYPGPTIRARKGEAAIVRARNGLTFDSNIHLHGGYVPAKSDGHPMDVIAPGGTFDYAYPNEQDAAPLWYHDHAHGRTARTLYYGLVGCYLLEDAREERLDLPRGEHDVPIVLADHAFNRDGSLRYAENVDVGFLGDTILVNGAVAPRMRVQRRLYRFRFVNASNSRIYDLRLGRGRPMVQVGSDGGLLERALRRSSVVIHPAERVDLLIDFREFRRRLADRAPERGRGAAVDARGHALRRRARRRRRGGADPARQDAHARAAPEAEREPALVAQPVGERGRRAVADGVAWLRPLPGRRPAAARELGAVAVAQPVEPQPPDAPARHAVPDRSSAARVSCRRTSAAGRTPSASRRARRSPCSRGSCPTPAATCSTATTWSTATRR